MKNKGDIFAIKGTNLTVNRMGYGAMRLSGPGIFGPPKDEGEAIAVLRTAVELGVNHIDTSDFYGPHVTNRIIQKALYPYAQDLVIVTKVGYGRTPSAGWVPALNNQELVGAIHDNLRNLRLESLPIVNLRVGGKEGPDEGTLKRALTVLIDLKNKGLIQNIGVSNVTPEQYETAAEFTSIVSVQNEFNLMNRTDDQFVETLAAAGIPYVPFFPLGGFQPFRLEALVEEARNLGATPMQVALAWLLQRSPNILVIPGTSSVTHLRENMLAAQIKLSSDSVNRLNNLSAEGEAKTL
jgi:pyridoxine 4-dehydrogenase